MSNVEQSNEAPAVIEQFRRKQHWRTAGDGTQPMTPNGMATWSPGDRPLVTGGHGARR